MSQTYRFEVPEGSDDAITEIEQDVVLGAQLQEEGSEGGPCGVGLGGGQQRLET